MRRPTLLVLIVPLCLTACGGGSDSTSDEPAATVTVTETVTVSAPAASASPESVEFRTDDFALRVKVLSRDCFGSAGCNVTYEVVPTYSGGPVEDLDGVVVDLTYELVGSIEKGTVGTISFDSGSYDTETKLAQTLDSSVKLSAKAVEVSVF